MQLATAQKELARAHVLAEAFYASDKDGESEREKDVTMKMATARFHVHKAEEAVNKVKTSLSQAEAESMAAMSTEEGEVARLRKLREMAAAAQADERQLNRTISQVLQEKGVLQAQAEELTNEAT